MGFKILLLDITTKTHRLITHTKTRKKVNDRIILFTHVNHTLSDLVCTN